MGFPIERDRKAFTILVVFFIIWVIVVSLLGYWPSSDVAWVTVVVLFVGMMNAEGHETLSAQLRNVEAKLGSLEQRDQASNRTEGA